MQPTGAPIDPKAFRFSRKIPESPSGLTELALDAAVLAHGAADLADVRIADASDHQIPYLLEKRGDMLTLNVPVIPEKDPTSPQTSRYRLVLPSENLPAARLVLSTSERTFQRRVWIKSERAGGRGSEYLEEALGRADWRHDDPDNPAPALTLDLRSALGTNWVTVIVDEGDNQTLPLTGARIELPLYRLRFFYPENGKLWLLYGQEGLSAPRYDLELLAHRLDALPSHELTLDKETPTDKENPATVVPEKNPMQARLFWAALVVAVLVVLGLLVRLLRTESV